MTYVNYLNLEKGKSLPKGSRIEPLQKALGLASESSEARELARAYFNALGCSSKLLDTLSGPTMPAPDLPSRQLAEEMTHQVLRQRSVNLTTQQWKTRSRDIVTQVCNCFLNNSVGWVSIQELSEATKFTPKEIKKALQALASAKLVKLSGDKAQSPLAGKFVKHLPTTPETAELLAAIRNQWKQWISGIKPTHTKAFTARITKTNMERLWQHLDEALNLAGVYADAQADRKESAVYYIGAHIYQAIPKNSTLQN
jgi:hypothetical protein